KLVAFERADKWLKKKELAEMLSPERIRLDVKFINGDVAILSSTLL
ncbi:hypothetical protein CCACVL1_02240, partial [Corchorus capsularis]